MGLKPWCQDGPGLFSNVSLLLSVHLCSEDRGVRSHGTPSFVPPPGVVTLNGPPLSALLVYLIGPLTMSGQA